MTSFVLFKGKKYIVVSKNIPDYIAKGWTIPNNIQIKKVKVKDKKHIKTKINLSKIKIKIPLYDYFSESIKFIYKYDVFEYVNQQHYRLPIESQMSKFNVLKNYDYKTLTTTYEKVIYNSFTKNITNCINPSTTSKIPHKYSTDPNLSLIIEDLPYFDRDVLIKYTINLDLIKVNDKTPMDVICSLVQKRSISRESILKHTDYIRKMIGFYIVRYYSFNGNVYINAYLRNLKKHSVNKLLEKQILLLWKLIRGSPSLSHKYTTFRFISEANHLSHLKIGDNYENSSFMSTTRNPFASNDEYSFGNIVLKINVPKGMKGVMLMIEMFSYFPDEQEVLLAPHTILKLVNKGFKFYHPNKNIENRIVESYEFDIIDRTDIKIDISSYLPSPLIKNIDFSEIKLKGDVLNERINDFQDRYLSEILQFTTKIDKKKITLLLHNYDSSDSYSDFYYYKKNDGVALVFQNPKNSQICLLIELGKSIQVNYHVDMFHLGDCPNISNEELMILLSNVANAFNIHHVVIYPNRISCNYVTNNSSFIIDNEEFLLNKYRYQTQSFNKDIYEYAKYRKIRFDDILGIIPTMQEKELKILATVEVPEYYRKKKIFKDYNGKDNILDFYVYLVENECFIIKSHERRLGEYIVSKKILSINIFSRDFRYLLLPRVFLKRSFS
jgi:hypothetical protein